MIDLTEQTSQAEDKSQKSTLTSGSEAFRIEIPAADLDEVPSYLYDSKLYGFPSEEIQEKTYDYVTEGFRHLFDEEKKVNILETNAGKGDLEVFLSNTHGNDTYSYNGVDWRPIVKNVNDNIYVGPLTRYLTEEYSGRPFDLIFNILTLNTKNPYEHNKEIEDLFAEIITEVHEYWADDGYMVFIVENDNTPIDSLVSFLINMEYSYNIDNINDYNITRIIIQNKK